VLGNQRPARIDGALPVDSGAPAGSVLLRDQAVQVPAHELWVAGHEITVFERQLLRLDEVVEAVGAEQTEIV
jgi:hypothetical protein